jgi:hypothetical protein
METFLNETQLSEMAGIRGVTQIRRFSRAEEHALLCSAGASGDHDDPCVSDYRWKIERGIRSLPA